MQAFRTKCPHRILSPRTCGLCNSLIVLQRPCSALLSDLQPAALNRAFADASPVQADVGIQADGAPLAVSQPGTHAVQPGCLPQQLRQRRIVNLQRSQKGCGDVCMLQCGRPEVRRRLLST